MSISVFRVHVGLGRYDSKDLFTLFAFSFGLLIYFCFLLFHFCFILIYMFVHFLSSLKILKIAKQDIESKMLTIVFECNNSWLSLVLLLERKYEINFCD